MPPQKCLMINSVGSWGDLLMITLTFLVTFSLERSVNILRKSECEALRTQLDTLIAESEKNTTQLQLIRRLIGADDDELAQIEAAILSKHTETTTTPPADLAEISIDEAGFSPQLKGHLRRQGFQNLLQIAEKGEAGLREEYNFRDGSIANIRAVLAKHGHTLE